MFEKMNCIYYGGQSDKQGRPVVFVLLRNFNLKKVPEEQFCRYVTYLSDKFVRDMPAEVDNFILVIDCYGFGYKQMFVKHAKAMLYFL